MHIHTYLSDLQEFTGESLSSILTEGLYACYPEGGYYRRHVDSNALTSQSLRLFSFLIYLNEGWQESDGGCLRIHTDGGGDVPASSAAPSYVDVPPRAGTLVLFRSNIPHEVLDTSKPRMAVAGWFNKPPDGETERRRFIAGLAGVLGVGSGAKSIMKGRHEPGDGDVAEGN